MAVLTALAWCCCLVVPVVMSISQQAASDLETLPDSALSQALPQGATYVGPTTYHVLGPFPSGSRQVGGDVLESFGGIHNVPIGDTTLYPTDLSTGGNTTWASVEATSTGGVSYGWPNANWTFMGNALGHAVFNYRGWAVGEFNIPSNGSYEVYCAGMGSIEVSGHVVVGDPYNLFWQHTVLSLAAGTHKVFAYFRSSFLLQIYALPSTSDYPLVEQGERLFPDVMDGTLLGRFLSVPVYNAAPTRVKGIRVTSNTPGVSVTLTHPDVELWPRQSLPLTFELSPETGFSASQVLFTITCPTTTTTKALVINHTMVHVPRTGAIFRYTFRDFDGTVQYGQGIPPQNSCPKGCPVLLTTHGAGSKAEWLIPHYRVQSSAWVLAPNGRTRFAYDWEGTQYWNALTALIRLSQLHVSIIAQRKPDPTRVVFAGHSMGGHGCYVLSGQNADLALGVNCAAGWVRYEVYSPYHLNQAFSGLDPVIRGLLLAALSDTSGDLLLGNVVGVPYMARIGGEDLAVNPWQPRRMVRLYDQLSGVNMAGKMSEIPGEPHWWDGVVDDDEMQQFFDSTLETEGVPDLPERFVVTCTHLGRFGSRGGLKVLQVVTMPRVARIFVRRHGVEWHVTTDNVKRFGWVDHSPHQRPKAIVVDGTSLPVPHYHGWQAYHYCADEQGRWTECTGDSWILTERSPPTAGPVRQVLEGTETLIVVGATRGPHMEHALYLSNHLYVQGRNRVPIFLHSELTPARARGRNLILLGGPTENEWTKRVLPSSPVSFPAPPPQSRNGSTVDDELTPFALGRVTYSAACLGVQYLMPWGGEASPRPHHPAIAPSLAVVVAGTDSCGFDLARRVFPVTSGLLIPDYLVMSEDFKGLGASGYLASGYWNNKWKWDVAAGFARAANPQ